MTRPESGGTRPAAVASSVVLPTPDGPASATTDPGRRMSDTPATTARPALPAVTSLRWSRGPRAAGSVAEAMKALEEIRPDVLVSDIGMPGEDGSVLLRKLRALEAQRGWPSIPAVALTAYARGEDRRRALLSGFRMHVPKPVEPVELAEAIARAVR